jgi:hypothetical protein
VAAAQEWLEFAVAELAGLLGDLRTLQADRDEAEDSSWRPTRCGGDWARERTRLGVVLACLPLPLMLDRRP